MQTLLRPALLATLALAWSLAANDRAPLTLLLISQADAASNSSEERRPGKSPGELASLRVMTRVIIHIKENYVDPRRVNPKEMMVAALEGVEKTVPDVMVEGKAESGVVKVIANGLAKDFDISQVDSLWRMSFTLKDVFDFLGKHTRAADDPRDIEYAAVGGMLATLDPHSVLLRPEFYREMKTSTRGEFGGLGFVIQMREGILTVVKVLPKTPAFRAGIRKDDQITRIGEESTVNLDVNEAVSKLRGPVDSPVTITLQRKSWDKPQVMTLTRALITIESVQSKLLAKQVGYVRLKNFQGNTSRDLERALVDLSAAARSAGSASGLKGLVLDLRGNPGGLLDQAISVADVFLSSGTIVATIGLSDRLREEKRAHREEGDEAFPIVALVNAGSASASEIVAGALKNQDRAVVVGRQTFGKGSVQVLYDLPDEGALKLTVAKYLTPGDVSIQEVGITPDIELVPTLVSEERVDVFSPRRSMGEADLERHFANPSGAAEGAKKRAEVVRTELPSETLKYLKDDAKKATVAKKAAPTKEKPRDPKAGAAPAEGEAEGAATEVELDDQLDAEAQDEVREDFEIRFARDLLLEAPFVERKRMLAAAKPFIEAQRVQEETRIAAAIAGLGLDWAAAPASVPPTSAKAQGPRLVGQLKPSAETRVKAGDTFPLELTVENRGGAPVWRLRAWTESENPFLDRREFLLGQLQPGERRSWSVTVKLPRELTSRQDAVTVRFQDDSGTLPDTSSGELAVLELPRPAFAYTWSIVDDCATCNGDGLAQRGEAVKLVVDVTNTGTGKALDTFATIRNGSDASLFIEKGRFKLGPIAPSETRSASFQLEVKRAFRADDFSLKLAVVDEPLEEFMTDKLVVPVAADSTAPLEVDAARTPVRLAPGTSLYASAVEAGRVLGTLAREAGAKVQARGAALARVELEGGRVAFVRIPDLRTPAAQRPGAPSMVSQAPELRPRLERAPAKITLNANSGDGAQVVASERFRLSGSVVDPKLLDVYVLVNDQKVFFKAKAVGDAERLDFVTDFPLKEGNNYVGVVARQSTDFSTRKTFIVRRRAQAIAQKVASPHGTTATP